MLNRLLFVTLMLATETGHAQVGRAGGALPDSSTKTTTHSSATVSHDKVASASVVSTHSVTHQPVRRPPPATSKPSARSHTQAVKKGR